MQRKRHIWIATAIIIALGIIAYFIFKGSNIMAEKPKYKKSVEYIMEGAVEQ